MNWRLSLVSSILAFALLLTGCGAVSPPLAPGGGSSASQAGGVAAAPLEALPGDVAVAGWSRSGEPRQFDAENLYDLVDGQADAFFAYAFEQVATQDYRSQAGQDLRIEIWQMQTPEDAFGLYTTFRSGAPVAHGNEGVTEPGRSLDFWQGRYLVRFLALQPVSDADLRAFAEEVAEALPAGGSPPALLDRLPQDGLVQGGTIFFHEEISIQSYLWLGGENLLELGPEVDGLLARYDLGEGVAQLLLVQYPDARGADAGRKALQAGQIEGLVLADAHQDLLGAIFGQVEEPQARALLVSALKDN